MNSNTIFTIIKTNDSDVDFIKEDMRVKICLISPGISMGYIFLNGNCIFTFTFNDVFKHKIEDRIYFTRDQYTVFSWDSKGFKLVPKEI